MDQNYTVEPIVLDTTQMKPPASSNDLYENRKNGYFFYERDDIPTCSIVVMAYNRLERTKYCVECILKYTQDINYELILIDNGSSDGTLEFFQSVPHANKQIVRIEKNMGIWFPFQTVNKIYKGKYLAIISNDVYVTANWLSNLLTCMESDRHIGLVMPVSTSVSNRQQVNLEYKTMEEMQEKAAAFNQSDPSKWEERIRLVTVITIYSRELMDTVGFFDLGFIHDFSEDDLSIRIRRAGYRLILCEDTFVCHDHDHRNENNPQEFRERLNNGRQAYLEKYRGIDAWNDIYNTEIALLSYLPDVTISEGEKETLCIDVRCGNPVLEMRNYLRCRGIPDVTSSAFTTDAKYYADLKTVAHNVACDRIDFIQEHYLNDSFDIVLLGEPINFYSSPIKLLQKLYGLLKKDGVLLFKQHNAYGLDTLLRSMGQGSLRAVELATMIPPKDLIDCINLFGPANIQIVGERFPLSQADQDYVDKLVASFAEDAQKDKERLMTKDYLFCVTKSK